ncbi:unnamed protein product [Lasius platythorax]|uniref:Uncharacterized protein n=1 Tax=Lasius platythorax TaxID=488582 RepID=A0AAV2N4X7_9HYME
MERIANSFRNNPESTGTGNEEIDRGNGVNLFRIYIQIGWISLWEALQRTLERSRLANRETYRYYSAHIMKLLLQTDLRAKNTCCPFSENSEDLELARRKSGRGGSRVEENRYRKKINGGSVNRKSNSDWQGG